MLKFAVFALVVAVARAGVLDYSHGYAAPVVAKIAAPAASSHASFTQHTVSHAAPVAHYAAAPVAHYAAPVAHYAAPVAKVAYAAPIAKAVVADHYAPPHYDFEYAVHDPHTGDVKSQKESRQGDVVHGSYSLIEADGSKRVVEYTADDHSGFNAVVHREHAQHPVAVKAVAPIVKTISAAPVLKYAAPALSYGHAAPALAYAAPSAHHITHHY